MPVSGGGARWSAREQRIAYRARMAELSRRQEARQERGPIEVIAVEVIDLRSRGGVTPHITPWFIEDGLPTRRVGDLENLNAPIP